MTSFIVILAHRRLNLDLNTFFINRKSFYSLSLCLRFIFTLGTDNGGSLLVGSVTRFRDSFSVLSIFKNENITKEGSKYCQIRKNPQKVPKDIQNFAQNGLPMESLEYLVCLRVMTQDMLTKIARIIAYLYLLKFT